MDFGSESKSLKSFFLCSSFCNALNRIDIFPGQQLRKKIILRTQMDDSDKNDKLEEKGFTNLNLDAIIFCQEHTAECSKTLVVLVTLPCLGPWFESHLD